MVVIPQFLLRKLYKFGSLRLVPEGLAFDVVNALGPGMLIQVNLVQVGPLKFLAHQIHFRLGDKLIPATEIDDQNPMTLLLNQTATCILKLDEAVEDWLSSGLHTITVDLLSREAGNVKISIQDHLHLSPA